MRIPAPSPVLGSHPHAPRCAMRSSMVSASETIWCDFLPLMLATKPTPQESFSNEGSYNPALLISFNSLKIYNDTFFEVYKFTGEKVRMENVNGNFLKYLQKQTNSQ